MAQRPRVVVVGAGVIGLSTAVCLAETFGQQLDITVVAEHFSPDTTSDRSGANFVLGGSYIKGGKEADSNREAFEEFVAHNAPLTMQRYTDLRARLPEEEIGIRVVTTYKFYRDAHPRPWWSKDLCFDFKELDRDEAQQLGIPYKDFKTFWAYKSYLVDATRYLGWLLEEFRERAGKESVLQHKLCTLKELQDYDVIVNCSGLGARELVHDSAVYPVRGQLVIVRAPQVEALYHNRENDLSMVRYVVPRGDGTVLLGGTADEGTTSTVVDPVAEREICDKCTELVPALRGAEVVEGWVGLRPVRNPVRLEVESHSGGPPVVHNYGHGGQGFILSWGSAVEACRLTRECLQEKGFRIRVLSKL